MSSAVLGLQKEEIDKYIKRYKEKNGIDKFKNGEKKKVIREFKETELGKELDVLKETIRERRFD